MDVLSYVALAMLLVIVALIAFLIWFMGGLPGRVAAKRQHPYAQASQVGGWASLFLGIVIWPVVLMWAYMPHSVRLRDASSDANDGGEMSAVRNELASMKLKIEDLKKQIQSAGGNA